MKNTGKRPDKKRYSPEILKGAIQAHPILFYNDELFVDNIHYVSPEIHFQKGGAIEEIDIWLENVRRNNENVRELNTYNERRALAPGGSGRGGQLHAKTVSHPGVGHHGARDALGVVKTSSAGKQLKLF